MEREIKQYTTEAEWLQHRSKDITSTDVSVLFGLNKYTTLFELWHAKKSGDSLDFTETDYIRWGQRLEETIANGVAEDNGWVVHPFKEYVSIPTLRIGSSFDFKMARKTDTGNTEEGILEIKNVNQFIFKDEWEKDGEGNIEAPPHIELQVQHQMLVSGHKYCVIAAFINGNSIKLIERKADKEIQDAILEKVAEFWKSIEDNVEPKLDFTRDAKTIAKLYGYAEPGKIYNAEENSDMLTMVKDYYEAGQIIKDLEAKRSEIKSRILIEIGDSEKVVSPLFSISAGTVGPAEVAYTRQGYRMFKINPKKELKEMVG